MSPCWGTGLTNGLYIRRTGHNPPRGPNTYVIFIMLYHHPSSWTWLGILQTWQVSPSSVWWCLRYECYFNPLASIWDIHVRKGEMLLFTSVYYPWIRDLLYPYSHRYLYCTFTTTVTLFKIGWHRKYNSLILYLQLFFVLHTILIEVFLRFKVRYTRCTVNCPSCYTFAVRY
jgi:hypothetical protein